MSAEKYIGQMKLLVRLLPYVLKDKRLALKGGTAINVFYRNLPRISVDIDLVYLPLEDRDTSFKNIHLILKNIKNDLISSSAFKGIKILSSNLLDGSKETKLFIEHEGCMVKVEPNFTVRGVVGPVAQMELCPKVKTLTFLETTIQCVSLEDLYGGKICAALDRGHPRDLFDMKILMEQDGISHSVKNAFLFYLISTNRPIIELLNPTKISLDKSFNDEFLGMCDDQVKQTELEEVRDKLIMTVNSILSDQDKLFLISVESNNPNWSLAPISNIFNYPSVKWKIYNVGKMAPHKMKANIQKLQSFFAL